jgi:hypothetical protein
MAEARTPGLQGPTQVLSTRRRLTWLVAAVVLVAGALGPSALGAFDAGASASASAGSLTANFVKTSDWGSGFVGQFNIANGGAPVGAWTLKFQLPSNEPITGSWNGNMAQSGATYTVTNATWNGSLATGGTATFGFQGGYSATFVAPSNCTINGNPCSGAGTSGGGTSGTGSGGTGSGGSGSGSGGSGGGAIGPVTATFAKTSDWGSGFVGSYTVANSGSPISSWTLVFSLPSSESITGIWSGNLSQNGSTYTVTNAAWNGAVGTAGSATVGFQGTYSGAFVPPTSCTINGSPCSASSGSGTGGSGSGSGGSGTGAGGTGGTGSGSGSSGGGSGSGSSAGGSGSFAFAPYVDATVDTPPFGLAGDMQATHTKDFMLGFVVSQTGACQASWGSYYPVSTGYYASDIQALRQAGGDVGISFGGQASEELADACTSVSALQAQYQSVVNTYHLSRIDFDIEGADEGNTASLSRRFQAAVGLEQANPGLSVSLTLPVLPSGLDYNGLNVLKTALTAGVRVDLVNVMAMDYGDGPAPSPAGKMGTYAIQAAQSTESQLAALEPAKSSAQLWKMVGVTPMLGVNDITDEVFGLTDASQLEAFAHQVGMGELSMWAATRDVQCPPGQGSSDTCSGVAQQSFAFSKIFSAFTG